MKYEFSPFLGKNAFKPYVRFKQEEKKLQTYFREIYEEKPDYTYSSIDSSLFQKQFNILIEKLVLLGKDNNVSSCHKIKNVLNRIKIDLNHNSAFNFVGDNVEDRKQEANKFFKKMKEELEYVLYKMVNSNNKVKIYNTLVSFLERFDTCTEGVSNGIHFAFIQWSDEESFQDIIFKYRNKLAEDESTIIKFEEKTRDSLQSHIDTNFGKLLHEANFDVIYNESKDPFSHLVEGYYPRMREGVNGIILRYNQRNLSRIIKTKARNNNFLTIKKLYKQLLFFEEKGLGMDANHKSLYLSYLTEMQPLLKLQIISENELYVFDETVGKFGEAAVNPDFRKNIFIYLDLYLKKVLLEDELKENKEEKYELLKLLENSLVEGSVSEKKGEAEKFFENYIDALMKRSEIIIDINKLTKNLTDTQKEQYFLQAVDRGEIEIAEALFDGRYIYPFQKGNNGFIYEKIIFNKYKVHESNYLIKFLLNKNELLKKLKLNDEFLNFLLDVLYKHNKNNDIEGYREFFKWPLSVSLKIFSLSCLLSPNCFKNIYFESSEQEKDHLLSSLFVKETDLFNYKNFESFLRSIFRDPRKIQILPKNALIRCPFKFFKIILKKFLEYKTEDEINEEFIESLIKGRHWNKVKYLLLTLQNGKIIETIRKKLRYFEFLSENIEEISSLSDILVKKVEDISNKEIQSLLCVNDELKCNFESLSRLLNFYNLNKKYKDMIAVFKLITPDISISMGGPESPLVQWLIGLLYNPYSEFNKFFNLFILTMENMESKEIELVVSSALELKSSRHIMNLYLNSTQLSFDIATDFIADKNKYFLSSLRFFSIKDFSSGSIEFVKFLGSPIDEDEFLLFIKVIIKKFGFSDSIYDSILNKLPNDFAQIFKDKYPPARKKKSDLIINYSNELKRFSTRSKFLKKYKSLFNVVKLKLSDIYANNDSSEIDINEGINKMELLIYLEQFRHDYYDCVSENAIDYLRNEFLNFNCKNKLLCNYLVEKVVDSMGDFIGKSLQAFDYFDTISVFKIFQTYFNDVDNETRIEKVNLYYKNFHEKMNKLSKYKNKYNGLIKIFDLSVKIKKLNILLEGALKEYDSLLQSSVLSTSSNIVNVFDYFVKISEIDNKDEVNKIKINFFNKVDKIKNKYSLKVMDEKENKYSSVNSNQNTKLCYLKYNVIFKEFVTNSKELGFHRKEAEKDFDKDLIEQSFSMRMQLYNCIDDFVRICKSSLDYRSSDYQKSFISFFSHSIIEIVDRQGFSEREKQRLVEKYLSEISVGLKPENHIFSRQNPYYSGIHFYYNKFIVFLKYVSNPVQVETLKNNIESELRLYQKDQNIPDFLLSYYFDQLDKLALIRKQELSAPRHSFFGFIGSSKVTTKSNHPCFSDTLIQKTRVGEVSSLASMAFT